MTNRESRLPDSMSATLTQRIPVRSERKYLLRFGAGESASALVRRKLPALERHHPARRISSLYFDTATYASYWQSNAGLSNRAKLRLRWYGELGAETRFRLELKRRANWFGWKVVADVDALDLANLRWSALRGALARQIEGEARVALDLLPEPVLVTHYRREYLHAPSLGVRLTVDTDLTFYDQRLRSKPNLRFDRTRAPFTVIETKADKARERVAIRLVRPLGLRHTRFSKYCYGLESFTKRR